MRVVSLNEHWNAVLMEDGSVLLQHKKAYIWGSGQEVDMERVASDSNNLAFEKLQEIGLDRLLVRSLILSPDGSVSYDEMAISPAGIPKEPFKGIPSAPEGAGWYMQNHQKTLEYILANEEEVY